MLIFHKSEGKKAKLWLGIAKGNEVIIERMLINLAIVRNEVLVLRKKVKFITCKLQESLINLNKTQILILRTT